MAKQQKGLLIAGTVHARIQNPDGTWPASFFDVETDALSISTSVEFVQALSKRRLTYNQPFVSIPLPQPAGFDITFSEVSRRILAAKLAGVLTPITSPSAAFADVAVTTVPDEWVSIGHDPIADDATFKVTDSTGATTYTEGPDYEVNLNLGLLLAISDGAIAEGAEVQVSGTEDAVNGERLDGLARVKTVMEIKVDGWNLANDEPLILEAPKVVIASNDAIDFFSSEIIKAPLTGTMELPGRNRPPFTIRWPKNRG